MTITRQQWISDGTQVLYIFNFPSIDYLTDVFVEIDDVITPQDDPNYPWSFANTNTVEFATAPPVGTKIEVYRDTNIDDMDYVFYPGSSIRAKDLNDNFNQLLFSEQETLETIRDEIDEAIIRVDQLDFADIIEESEMADGQTYTQWDDTKLSTAGAQKRFFQPLLSDIKPPADEPIEPGKLWYQKYKTAANKEVQSFNIYDGTEWQNISSGQVIPNPFQPDSIIYVDPQGNDNNPGRRPDEAYRTIKAAVADANAKVASTVSTVSSASYNNATGFVNIQTVDNHDLIPGYTVTLTPITWSCTTGGSGNGPGTALYPEVATEFRVGSIQSPKEFRIFVGTTDKVHTYQSGGVVTPKDVRIGDGYTIQCAPGVYHEKLPIRIEAKNLSIIGTSLRNTYVHPDIYTSASSDAGSGKPAYESPDRVLMTPIGKQGDVDIYEQEVQIMFEMDSGSYLTGFTFAGLKSLGARGVGGDDPDPTYGLPAQQGWVSAHRSSPDKAFITKSPYIQNATHFSDLQTNNADFDINFLAGEGGDATSGPAGGGILVDGERLNPSSPLRSYVVDAFTQIALGGPGVLATNNGYAQLVSFFGTFCWYHAKSKNGGQLNLSNCTSDFGQYGLIADGKSPSSIFSGSLDGAVVKGDQFIRVKNFTRGTGWDAPRKMTPGDTMVIEIDGVLYPILSSRENSEGYEINIFAPKSDESAVPIPANASNVVNAVYDNVTGFVTFTTDKAHTLLAGRTAFISPMVWECPAPDAGTASYPSTEEELKITDVTGSTTFIVYVGPNDKPHTYVSGGVVTPTDINPDTFENGGVQKGSLDGVTVLFYLQSYISTGGHTMEFVGSGTDYSAHPDFGGVPRPENQTLEVGGVGPSGSRLAYLNGGRVWLSSTDENGNFKVGETFVVNQKTGSIYILPEAVKSTFRLNEDLDLRGFKIWQDPATAGRDADLQIQPAGQGDVILGSDSYESDGSRTEPAAIREPILERGMDDKRKYPVVTQRDLGYDADEVPVSCLLGKLAFTDSAPAVTATTSSPLPNEIKFEVSGNKLIIKFQPADGALKTTELDLT